MSGFVIFPWKKSSAGAKLLKEKLNAEWADQFGTYPDSVVINWGNGYQAVPSARAVFNKRGIETCTSKLGTYKKLSEAGVPTLEWTKSQDTALDWHESGCVVYGRNDDSGMDGSGITVYASGAKAPRSHAFYTKRFRADREFRVNCAFGAVIDVREKKKRIDSAVNALVRCGDDWLWCMNDLEPYTEAVKTEAIRAVAALGLDFGGCDVGLRHDGTVCIFEVNSAPWLTDLMAERYARAFTRKANELTQTL